LLPTDMTETFVVLFVTARERRVDSDSYVVVTSLCQTGTTTGATRRFLGHINVQTRIRKRTAVNSQQTTEEGMLK